MSEKLDRLAMEALYSDYKKKGKKLMDDENEYNRKQDELAQSVFEHLIPDILSIKLTIVESNLDHVGREKLVRHIITEFTELFTPHDVFGMMEGIVWDLQERVARASSGIAFIPIAMMEGEEEEEDKDNPLAM